MECPDAHVWLARLGNSDIVFLATAGEEGGRAASRPRIGAYDAMVIGMAMRTWKHLGGQKNRKKHA